MFTDQQSREILQDVSLWRASRKIKFDIYNRIEDESLKYVNSLTEPYIKSASCIIDGGAFDGTSSNHISSKSNSRCQFYLYEPDLQSYEKIKNLTLQNIKPSIFNIALSDKVNEKSPFFSTGGLSSRLVSDSKFANSYVITTTIDDEVSKISTDKKKSLLIKLHIEGTELNALLGARETIRNFKPSWIINCSHNLEQLLETPKFLASQGYSNIFLRCHSLFGEGLTLFAPGDK